MNVQGRETPSVLRGEYLDRIKDALRTIPVTVLTGIRRSGKTFLLKEIIAALKAQGVDGRHIIYLDLEKFVFPQASSRKELKQYLASSVSAPAQDNTGAGQTGSNGDAEHFYIFLDEAQAVAGWEKTLEPLIEQGNVSIMAALSGAAPVKNGKKSFLAGNWLEIKITPLSYSEYRGTGAGSSREKTGLLGKAAAIRPAALKLFNEYVRHGGFPATVVAGFGERRSKLSDIYAAILYHDVVTRCHIKNICLAEMIIKYIFEHLGEECSAGKLTAHFKREKYTKNLSLVPELIRSLEAAPVIVRVYRINLATMKTQTAGARYFAADHALFHALYGGAVFDAHTPPPSGLLAGMIVSELRRRDYEVYSGKAGEKSIDFVALKDGAMLCIQTFLFPAADVQCRDPEDKTRASGGETRMTLEQSCAALNDARALVQERYRVQRYIIFFDRVPAFEDGVEGRNPAYDDDPPRLLCLPDFLLCRDY